MATNEARLARRRELELYKRAVRKIVPSARLCRWRVCGFVGATVFGIDSPNDGEWLSFQSLTAFDAWQQAARRLWNARSDNDAAR